MTRKTLLALLALLAGTACNGGGGSQVAGGGVGGTGISSGSVTAFGSFFVTGTGWTLVSSGVVEIDGETSGPAGSFDEDDLQLGMYLTVEGRRNNSGSNGRAERVVADEAIRGAVEQTPFDLGDDQRGFSILGQNVVIDDGLTVFAGTGFATLDMGDVIEVSGPTNSAGQIRATRVEWLGTLALGTTEVEFKGSVANLGAAHFDLRAADVSFDCAGTTDCSALPGGAPAAGQLVEVEGIQTSDGATPEVDALVIRPFTPFADTINEAENVEVEGAISDFAGLGSFSVNWFEIDASMAELEPNDPALFADGVYVEVEGDIVAGVLEARRIELEDGAARVSAVIPSGGLDRLNQDEIVLLREGTSGQPGFQELVIEVAEDTRLEDESGGDDDLDLDELLVGDFLEVRGVVLGPGRIQATEIERDDVDDVELRGPVESVDTDASDGVVGYTALGIFVELVQGTTDVPGGDVAAFLAGLSVGEILEATDDQDGSEETFDVADEVEEE